MHKAAKTPFKIFNLEDTLTFEKIQARFDITQQIPDRIRTDLKIDTPRKKKTVSDLTFTFRLDRGSHSENLCIPRAGLIDGDRSHAQFRMHTRRRPKVIFSAALGRYRAPRIRKKRDYTIRSAHAHTSKHRPKTSAEVNARGAENPCAKPAVRK